MSMCGCFWNWILYYLYIFILTICSSRKYLHIVIFMENFILFYFCLFTPISSDINSKFFKYPILSKLDMFSWRLSVNYLPLLIFKKFVLLLTSIIDHWSFCDEAQWNWIILWIYFCPFIIGCLLNRLNAWTIDRQESNECKLSNITFASHFLHRQQLCLLSPVASVQWV